MKKYAMRGACALFLALSLTVSALAASGGRFLRGGYTVEDGTLRMLCVELPEGGELTATVGTQEAEAVISTVAEEGLHTTVYCLIDVSGSMGAAQMQTAKDVMQAISDQMGEGDNMVITPLANTVDIGQVLDTPQARNDTIAALGQGNGYTNLYTGVVDSLNVLKTSTKYSQNRCLVILSDGQDAHKTGSTEAEAMDAIKSSDIPIYAVATLPQGAGREAQEYGKLLRSFASASLGGAGYTPTLDDLTGTEIGQEIWRSIQAGGVLDIDLASVDVPDGRDTMVVKAVYRTDDAEYVDTATVYTVDLPAPAPTPEPTVEPSPEPAPTSTPEPEPEPEPGGLPGWVVPAVIAGAAVLAVVITAVVLAGKRKKQKAAEAALKEIESIGATIPAEPEDVGETAPVRELREEAPLEQPEPVPSADPWTPTAPKLADCRVRLTALGYPDRRFDIDLMTHQGRSIGRDGRADAILEGDTKLSGVHCELEWDGAALYVQDRGSTNGTFVNGVPIQGKSWMPLEDGATLRIGAYEYRAKYTLKA